MIIFDCPSGINNKREGIQYGKFNKISYFSSTTNSERNANILLPNNYSEDIKYPVVYFLHGIFGNEDSMTGSGNGAVYMPANLALDNEMKELIIVCPNIYAQDKEGIKPGFHDDYFHGYDNFINELINDLMPYIAEHYSIATERENTAVCGFSMGGRTSLYIGFKRPDLFGYIGAFSPAPGVVPGTDKNAVHSGLFLEEEFVIQDKENMPYVTIISCGTKDNAVGSFPALYHEILEKNAHPHIWIEVPDADHDERAIRTGLYSFMINAFGINSKTESVAACADL